MQNTVPVAPNGDEKRQETEIKELICFLWDNYLQLYNSEKIIIMGVGHAYIGIKMLLLNRSDSSPPGKWPMDLHSRPRALLKSLRLSVYDFYALVPPANIGSFPPSRLQI